MPIEEADLIEFFTGDAEGGALVEALRNNAMRFVELFCEVIDVILQERFRDQVLFDTTDVNDVFLLHRTNNVTADGTSIYPP